MNPARSLMVTSTLPSRAHSASMSATTSSSVTTVRTTSTSFMIGAGLKKCMPTTRLGRWVATEISVTDSEEVLVARIASRLADPVQLGEDLLLEVEVLGHRLDDEVDVVQRVQADARS